jgi:fatty acid desaturase
LRGVTRVDTRPKNFVERDGLRGALALLRDWGAILLVAALSVRADSLVVYAVSVWAIGCFQFAIGEALLHEASHYNLFRRRRWNDDLEFLYALPFFKTVSGFRSEHAQHHLRLGGAQDHVVADYERFGFFEPDRNLFWLWFVKPVTGYACFYYVSGLSLRPFKSGVKIVAFWALAVFGFWYFGGLQFLLLYWIVPYAVSYCSLLYWSEVRDHFNAACGTRSNLSPVANLLTHNNGYHFVHHKYPTIPWYRLREAHNALCPRAGDISHGFLDTYRQLKSAAPPSRLSGSIHS